MTFLYCIRAADGRQFSNMEEAAYVQTARALIDEGIDFTVTAERKEARNAS